MKIDEAIRVLIEMERYPTNIKGKDAALELAIDALYDRKDREKNKPLSREALAYCRDMGLPVWVVAECITDKPSGWALAGKRAAISQNFTSAVLWYDTYETEWLAYRYPMIGE